MLIGCCASMIAPESDPVGIDSVELLSKAGYDYVELSLSHLTALSEQSFSTVVDRLRHASLPCLACNNFFPPTLRLTGRDANLERNVEYAKKAILCASRIGAKTIVFGSSGAKNVPPNFPLETAWTQVVDLLHCLGPIASENNIVIVIEPISRPESNFVLTAAEGLRLMYEVMHPNVRLLIDYYHLKTESESDTIVNIAGNTISHLHIASHRDRRFPFMVDDEMGSFLKNLQTISYIGCISIEAYTNDFCQDAIKALDCLKKWFDDHK